MPLIQTFDTFIAHTETPSSFVVHSIPASALGDGPPEPRAGVARFAEAAGLEIAAEIPLAGSGLPRILASMVAAPELYTQLGTDSFESWWRSTIDGNADLANFVEEVAYRPLIPTVMSPLELRSLADMATGLVVVLGFLQGNPALVVSGVAGMVVVRVVGGLARGAERAFEEAGYEWTRRLLRLRRHR